MSRSYFVYIISTTSDRVLYVGFTNNLIRRVCEHRMKYYSRSFSAQYNVWKLVYYECFYDMYDALDREKQLKNWRRSRKNHVIHKMNPEWRDLFIDLVGDEKDLGKLLAMGI